MAKILIIEDEEVLRTAYQMILKHDGHTVVLARDGADALKAVEAHKPDLIFLDLLMPKMSGMEFLENYYSDKSNKKTPIIIMSNLHDAQTVEKTLKLGAREFVVKSQMTPATLTELAKKWLS
jgi:CheY-like chemotaxis protein